MRRLILISCLIILSLVLGITRSVLATSYTFTSFDHPNAPYGTFAYGVNNSGQIVGRYQDGLGGHGFLRDSGGTFSTFDYPGATYTYAYGVNSTGQIVGEYYDASGSHGFSLTGIGGTFSSFDVPATANGVNNSGQIVGSYYDGSGYSHGYLRDSGGGLSTFDPPGAYHTIAYGVNDSGQIAGFYLDVNGRHGFLATPVVPEPSTLMLLGSGLAVLPLIKMRRRLKFWC